MNFAIEKEFFLKGLARIQGIVERRNTIPVLANVLIETHEGEICLTATDLEVGMRSFYPAKIKESGRITVSAKKLYEIVRELPEGELSFKAKENCWIEIRSGKAIFNIVGLSPEEFPHFPDTAQQGFISLPPETLREMIDKTTFAMSTDETKYNLNGIFFRSFSDDQVHHLSLVATDGHRLSKIEREIPAVDIPQLHKGVIFPRKGIMELKKMSEEGEGNLELGFIENSAVIRRAKTVVVMRLVDGEFPEYERVIPRDNEVSAIIPTAVFLQALRRMAILSSEKSRGVKISLQPGVLEVSSSNPEFGDAREEIGVDFDGQALSIGFNARYLLDILQSMEAEKVDLRLKDNLSPGLLVPEEEGNYLAVIMPMRL